MRLSSRSSLYRFLSVVLMGVLAVAGIFIGQILSPRTHAAPTGVVPNRVNELDCNGWSTKFASVKPGQRMLCTDPRNILSGGSTRLLDNGWYVGHDEPSVKFISSASGSGNHMTYIMQLAMDPSRSPTVKPNGHTVTDYAELSPAPWFGLPICDPNSFPTIGNFRVNPCTPDSDSNTGLGLSPTDAGSAFLELQFYPPGFQPFNDAISCDPTHYCAALNIDSLEAEVVNGQGIFNPACVEPVNFAYIQRNGVPAGPPSPQLADVSTMSPNAQTLLMNQGDRLVVTIADTAHGIKATVIDASTGQSGFIVASAANGFMNSNPVTCAGTPFDFHAEYDTARQQNQVPWAALEGGVLMEDEIGHFEPCQSVTNQLGFSSSNNGQTFSDPQMSQTCLGSFENDKTGEGPCSLATFLCANATTEGGVACPTNDSSTGALCEFSDTSCFPAGPRSVNFNGVTRKISWPIAGCLDNFFQNGDLDFDGSSYIADWPDGTPNHPTPFHYIGPFDQHGHPYPSIQFETDAGGSENNCDFSTGAGCAVPAANSAFYPFWTLNQACEWNFGNVIAHQTAQSFGGAAEYGTPDVARFAGTLTSPVIPNPQFNGRCG